MEALAASCLGHGSSENAQPAGRASGVLPGSGLVG